MKNYNLIRENTYKKLNKKLNLDSKRCLSLSMAVVTVFSSFILSSCTTKNIEESKEDKRSISGFHVVDDANTEKYNKSDLKIITMFSNNKTEYLFAKESKNLVPSLDEIKEMFDEILDLSQYSMSDYTYTCKEYDLITLKGAKYYSLQFTGKTNFDGQDLIINASLERINLGENLPKYQYMLTNIVTDPISDAMRIREKSIYTKSDGSTFTRNTQDFFFSVYEVDDFCNANDILTEDEIFNLEYQLKQADEERLEEQTRQENMTNGPHLL